ncbi:MAG: tetratricopeptide repeat protein [Bacteroidetes bacterium]|nr:tetratricopeptide repeat protein [Bacteroidota bacterium]
MAKQQPKPQPASAKKKEDKTEKPLVPFIAEPLAKKIFFVLAALLLVLMTTVSHQYGISGDENYHKEYGHHVVNFYTSLGHDTTAATRNGLDSMMVFYGGFYDGTATVLAKALPMFHEYDVRHFWNSIFGFVAILGTGLIAVEIMGWQAGLLALLFMAFSPRFFGESMNNPKDITMTTGYVLAYIFIIRFIKQLPKPSLKTALGLGASIAVAMGIRIGGLLLIPYAFMFYGLMMWSIYGYRELFDFSRFKDNVWPSLRWLLLATFIGYFGSLLFWPYGLVSPLEHPFEILREAQKYPVNIRILFAGGHLFSSEIPWNYIPQWLAITTPLFGLIGLALSFLLIPVMRKEKKLLLLFFLYFTLVFPVTYVIYQKAVLYDAMRHLYFVYPSIILLAALTFNYFLNAASRNTRYMTAGAVVVLLFLPARFMVANHPNEYVYFNELEGGMKGAYGNYELDYYMNSVKQCANWLHENEKFEKKDGEKLLLCSNANLPCNFYFAPDSANLNVGYISYRNRTNTNADYLILYNRFVDRELLLNGAFPPEQTIHTVEVDGVPIACVIKKTDKGDYLGQQEIEKGNYAGALQYLEPYSAKYPKNDVVLSSLGLCYLNAQQLDKAINVLGRTLSLNQDNMNAGYWLGLAYLYKQDYTQAAQILKTVVEKNQYFPAPYQALSECMARLGYRIRPLITPIFISSWGKKISVALIYLRRCSLADGGQ